MGELERAAVPIAGGCTWIVGGIVGGEVIGGEVVGGEVVSGAVVSGAVVGGTPDMPYCGRPCCDGPPPGDAGLPY